MGLPVDMGLVAIQGGAGFVFRARGELRVKPIDVNFTVFCVASFLVAVQNHPFSNLAFAKQVQLGHHIRSDLNADAEHDQGKETADPKADDRLSQ